MGERLRYIPSEYVQERPSVFPDEESFRISLRFASKYNELKAALDERGGAEESASVGDLVDRTERTVADRIRALLPQYA